MSRIPYVFLIRARAPAVALVLMGTAINSWAATIFESGTLGATGIPRNEIAGGSNVNAFVFVGVRFYIDQPVITSQIGGHFVRNIGANESFFGAIVALDNENDFPDSANLSTPDVIGATLLAFPEPSNEVFGALAKPLSPGWYALAFGSGLFGANGSGVAVANGTDIGEPKYIAWQTGTGWTNLTNPIFRNFRFVVEGQVVPEPTGFGSLLAVLIYGSLIRTAKRPGSSLRAMWYVRH